MANVDGQIILGLDINATAANIQTGINKILNTTKVRQIVLKTAIEKSETEKSIQSMVNEINKKTIKLGVEVNAKDVHNILAEQQKIASKQAEKLKLISNKSLSYIDTIKGSPLSGDGFTKLVDDFSSLNIEAKKLQTSLADIDPSNGEDVKRLSKEVEELYRKFQTLSKDGKIFDDVNSFSSFISNIEKARQKVSEYGKTYSAIKTRPDLVNELNELRKSAETISTPSELKTWNAEFEKFNTKVIKAGVHTKSLGDKIKNAVSNFAQFFSASRAIYEVVEISKQMISNVQELDSAMVELRKVTDATDAEFNAFLTNAKKRAVELGTTVTDLVKGTSDYSRLGFTLDEATKLGEAATIYANVGDDVDSIEQATSSLISTMKGFGIEASNVLTIVDKFNEVGNNFAISSGGIGDALQRSAAALSAAGNDIDQSIALIVAANNVIQDADTVGTMWKTVSMRIRGATTELEKAGLETDYMAKSTSDLRDTIKAITNIDGSGGFDILTDSGAFKPTYDIILGIAEVWEELGEVDPIGQSALLELLAGKRQGNALAAALTNVEDMVAVLETSQTASEGLGSAMEEYNIWLDSMEAKTQSFKAAFESLSSTIFDVETLKGFVDFGTNALTTIDSLIQKFGMFPSLLSLVAGGFSLCNKNLIGFTAVSLNGLSGIINHTTILGKDLSVIMQNFETLSRLGYSVKDSWLGAFSEVNVSALSKFNNEIQNGGSKVQAYKNHIKGMSDETKKAAVQIAKGEKGLTDFGIKAQLAGVKAKMAGVGVKILNTALNMLISFGISLALQGLITLFDELINKASKASEEANEAAEKAKETADSQYEEVKSLDELISKYEELKKLEVTDSDAREEIKTIQEQIVDLVGLEADNIDLVNGKLDEELSKLREKARLQAEEAKDSAVASYTSAQNASKAAVGSAEGSFAHPTFGGWAYVGDRDKTAEEILREAGYDLNVSSGGWFNNTTYVSDSWTKDLTMTQNASEKAKVIKEMLDVLKEADNYEYQSSKLYAVLYQQYEAYNKYGDAINDAAQSLLDSAYAYQKYDEETSKITVNSYESYLQYRNQLIDNIKNDSALQSAMSDGAITDENISNYVDNQLGLIDKYEQYYNRFLQLNKIKADFADSKFVTEAENHNVGDNRIAAFNDWINSLTDDELAIVYKVAVNTDTAEYTLEDWKKTLEKDNPIPLKADLKSLWNSEGFKDAKASLMEMAQELDGITPYNIEKLASESEELAEILEQDCMSAEFLAYIFQRESLGGDGFALVTEEALALNTALEGMKTQFDEVTDAKTRYDAAMEVPEKDEDFKSYAEAFSVLNDQFVAGTTNSNAFWAAAEFLFGDEQLALWGWGEGLDEIYSAMKKNKEIFEDADSAGSGFLERLYEISEGGKVLGDDGTVLAEIKKLSDGSYDFNIDALNLDKLADEMDMSKESVIACLEALSMWGDVDYYNIEEVAKVIEEIGIATDVSGKKAVNVDKLIEQLVELGKTDKEIVDIVEDLEELDEISLISADMEINDLIDSLEDLSIASKDGTNIEIEYTSLTNMMKEIGFTKTEAENLITKLSEIDGVQFTNQLGSGTNGITDVQSVLDYINSVDFSPAEGEVDTVTSAVQDLTDTLNDLDGKSISVKLDVVGTFKQTVADIKSVLGFAKGTKNAPDEDALVGEEGAELIQSGDHAYLAGTNGPEIVHLNKGDIVYTAKETKQILHSKKRIRGSIPAYSGGRASGTINTNKNYTSVLPTDTTSTSTSTGDANLDKWEKLVETKKYLLEMDRMTEEEYYNWLREAYKEHLKDTEKYADEIIEIEKELYEWDKKKIQSDIDDKITVLDYEHIQGLISDEEYFKQKNALYEQGYDDLQKLIKEKDLYGEDTTEQLQAEMEFIENIKDAHNSAYEAERQALDHKLAMNLISEEQYLIELQRLYDQYYKGQDMYSEEAMEIEEELYDKRVELVEKWAQAAVDAIDEITAATEGMVDAIAQLIEGSIDTNEENFNLEKQLLDHALAMNYISEKDYYNSLEKLYQKYFKDKNLYMEQYWENQEAVYQYEQDALEDSASAIEDIHAKVVEMIKAEHEEAIDAIEETKDEYLDLIEIRRKALEEFKSDEDYEKERSDKLSSIAELQRQLNALSYDTSAAGVAKYKEVYAQLKEAEEELAEFERERSYEVMNNQLDNEETAIETKYDDEIAEHEAFLDNNEALVEEAWARLNDKNNDLYNQLIEYNKKYSTSIADDVTGSWEKATEALQKYSDAKAGYKDIVGNIGKSGMTDEEYKQFQGTTEGKQIYNWIKVALDFAGSMISVGAGLLSGFMGIAGSLMGGTGGSFLSMGSGVVGSVAGLASGVLGVLGGFATGTDYVSKTGWYRTDELGNEFKFVKDNQGNQYRFLTEGSKVVDAKTTDNFMKLVRNPDLFANTIKNQILSEIDATRSISNVVDSSSNDISVSPVFQISSSDPEGVVAEVRKLMPEIAKNTISAILSGTNKLGVKQKVQHLY